MAKQTSERPSNVSGSPALDSISVMVLGTGSIGSRHLRVLEQQPGVVSIAVPKRSFRAAELAVQGQRVAGSFGEAVNMGATLGIIASTTGQHLEDGLLAIDHGLDILMEKPLAINSQDAFRLNQHAKDAGRAIYVGCVLRFSESLNIFRELLGEIGRIHSVRIECQSYFPEWQPERPYQQNFRSRAGEGGVLLDLIHEVDYAGWLFGWPEAIQAKVINLRRLGIDADEAAHLMWETPEGCTVTLTVDFLSRPTRRQMTAFGEHGTIGWDGVNGSVTLALAGALVRTIDSSRPLDEMFRDQLAAFIDTSLGKIDPRLATGDDGVKSLAVCDAARLASSKRREEKVKYP